MQKRKIAVCLCIVWMVLSSCSSALPDLPNVFRYNESKGIPTLDPAFARTQAIINPCLQLYNGLLQLDNELHVLPCIAHKYAVSPDGLQYTFSLRRDVFFHDSPAFPKGEGRRVAASDFVYSFYRLKSPSLASPGSWTLVHMDTCYAVNDSVLAVKLRRASPVFLGTLAMPYCFVVPHEAVEYYGAEFSKHPVGTGPFYLKAWREGEKLVLRRNRRYFEQDSSGARLPYLEAVTTTFVPDKQSEFLEFAKGKIDYLSGVHAASRDELLTRSGTLNPKYAGKVQMLQGPYLNTEYVGFLLNNSEFANKALQNADVRRAIAYGIDKGKMVKFLRSNLATPAANGFVPQGLPSFSSAVKGFEYNPKKAGQLLAKAGYPQGQNLPELVFSTTDDYLDICEFIQHELAALGIKIRINALSGAAYRQQVGEGKLSMFRASWIADYPDAESYLSLLYSKNAPPAGPNYTHFCNHEYDKKYMQSLAETSLESRYKLYQSLDSLIVDNVPVLPLFYDKAARFVRIGVLGMEPNPMNMLVLKQVRKVNN
ncbi:MAG: ABC transporter substrate-binding protein [Prevotellaceae bacterium]|jgi:peptide/nickel transport system substrate-binding protein|nr:ABC transporter substrate-binding protein [Prevotellaceae bacterium]